MTKFMSIIAILISVVLYWTTANVCKYNFAIEKRTKLLNIVTESIDPSLGNAQYFFYEELNCNDVDLDWDIQRVIDNLQTVTVIIYQELNTDIKGTPN